MQVEENSRATENRKKTKKEVETQLTRTKKLIGPT